MTQLNSEGLKLVLHHHLYLAVHVELLSNSVTKYYPGMIIRCRTNYLLTGGALSWLFVLHLAKKKKRTQCDRVDCQQQQEQQQ